MSNLPLPDNIGEVVIVEREDGSRRYYTIVDEIVHSRPQAPNRALCFQRLESRRDKTVQFRLSYYFADEMGWVFAQHAAYVPEADFQALIEEAIRRGWFKVNLP